MIVFVYNMVYSFCCVWRAQPNTHINAWDDNTNFDSRTAAPQRGPVCSHENKSSGAAIRKHCRHRPIPVGPLGPVIVGRGHDPLGSVEPVPAESVGTVPRAGQQHAPWGSVGPFPSAPWGSVGPFPSAPWGSVEPFPSVPWRSVEPFPSVPWGPAHKRPASQDDETLS